MGYFQSDDRPNEARVNMIRSMYGDEAAEVARNEMRADMQSQYDATINQNHPLVYLDQNARAGRYELSNYLNDHTNQVNSGPVPMMPHGGNLKAQGAIDNSVANARSNLSKSLLEGYSKEMGVKQDLANKLTRGTMATIGDKSRAAMEEDLRKRQNRAGIAGIAGTVIGGVGGAMIGGPAGAAVGAQIGGGIGSQVGGRS